MTVHFVNARFFQLASKNKGKYNGFSIEENIKQTITEYQLYWWLMLNMNRWMILHTDSPDRFDSTKPVDIIVSVDGKNRSYKFYRTTKDSVATIEVWGHKYTIEDSIANTPPSDLHRLTNFIEYSSIKKGGSTSPEISTPMRD